MTAHLNTSIDDFLTLVSENCPGGLDFVKKRAICRAAAEFCKKTWAWHEDVLDVRLFPSDNGVLDATRLALEISRHAIVWGVDDIRLAKDGTPLSRTSRPALDKDNPGWRLETTDTEPTHFFLRPQRELVYYPALAADADTVKVNIELVLLPSQGMVYFPDFLFNFYGEAIALGAAQRLASQKNSEWYNPDQAQYFLAVFNRAIQDAKVAQAKRVVDAINERRRRNFR